MEISTEDVEIKAYELLDLEPYHYIAMCRYKESNTWCTFTASPLQDKQALINSIQSSAQYYDELRIIKIRLPIGKRSNGL